MRLLPITLSSLLTLASAVDLRVYTSSNCIGNSWVCYNVAPGSCCTYPIEFSSAYWDLPAYSVGIAFTYSWCISEKYRVPGGPIARTCLTNNNLFLPSSAHWRWGTLKNRAEPVDEAGSKDCREPDVYIYTTPEGKQRAIDIPEGQAKNVTKMEWKELEKFQDTKKGIETEVYIERWATEEESG